VIASRKIIVTGTWGVGKTTVLAGLGDDICIVPEPARIALHEDPTIGADWRRFSGALLARSIAAYDTSPLGTVLFDRGIPDCLAYARWFGLDTASFIAAAESHQYHEDVMLFPAWRRIFVNDDLRQATFELASEFESTLVATFEDLGYRLVIVPKATIEERVRFLRDFIESLPA
jgi:predicted ATPase